jgi:hypothetical protein
VKVLTFAVLLCLATACGGGSTAKSPGASPTVQLPAGGIVNRPLCLALRTSIQGNLQTAAADRSAGDEAAAARAQSKVDADVVKARRIKNCGVDDLIHP